MWIRVAQVRVVPRFGGTGIAPAPSGTRWTPAPTGADPNPQQYLRRGALASADLAGHEPDKVVWSGAGPVVPRNRKPDRDGKDSVYGDPRTSSEWQDVASERSTDA